MRRLAVAAVGSILAAYASQLPRLKFCSTPEVTGKFVPPTPLVPEIIEPVT